MVASPIFSEQALDPARMDRGRLTVGTALIIGAGTLISLGTAAIGGTITPILALIHAALLAVVIGAGALVQRGRSDWAGLLLTSMFFLALALVLSPLVRAGDVAPTGHILSVLLAGLLLGGRAVLVVGGLALINMLALALINPNSWTNTSTSSLLVVMLTTGLTWLIIRTLERALGNAQQQTARAVAAQQALAEQQAALSSANDELHVANEQQRALLDLVRDLETPVIPLLDGVLVLPLVGHVDTRRAQQVTATVLAEIRAQRARIVIVDITGVSVVDTAVAQRLSQLAQSVRLLGAQAVLTGIRPEVAQTIVMQGIALADMQAAGRLQDGVLRVLSQEMQAGRWSGSLD